MYGLNRRGFLVGSAAAAATLGHGVASRRLLGADSNPEPERHTSKFKFSLAAYSYRGLLSGESPELTLFDFADDCAKFGLEGTELTSYYFPSPVTTDYLTRLRRHCFRQGLDVSGTAIGNDFGFTPGPERDKQIAQTKGWIEHAAKLGAPVIRIFAGHKKPGVDGATTHKLMVEGIEECCEVAGQHGIHLALENHGGPTSTADGLLELVRDVKSPWFGVNLDTGNFRTDDVYRDIERVAELAINVQVKVVTKTLDGKNEPTDFKRLASILRSSRYRGYVVLEYEEAGNPRAECERYLDSLRDAFNA